jgi:tetratricopeptide (TPR) repeat protein
VLIDGYGSLRVVTRLAQEVIMNDHHDDVRNDMTGSAHQVVQAARIAGDVHLHPASFVIPLPRQLPPPPAHFTGRDAELSRLDSLLSGQVTVPVSAVVVTAIAGAAGIGKTSLALWWAHQALDRFPDGQLYLNLRGYDPDPPLATARALDTILRSLGLPADRIPGDVEAMAALYRSVLADRRMLVLLDNAATADQVRPLLPNAPGCVVLVTSRSRLSGLVARDGAHRVTLDVLTMDEAERLLRQIVGLDRAESEPGALAQLARRCAYLPLALRVASERVAAHPHLTVADLVDELDAEVGGLDTLAADDDESTAVRTVFSWSYRDLPPGTRRLFRLLGLHPGPDISPAAAAALCGQTVVQTRRQVDLLVSVHLITESGRDRFQFHDLLRAYATERVMVDESEPDRQLAIRRLFQWYVHTAQAAMFAFYPQHPVIPMDPRPGDCVPLTFSGRGQARQWFTDEYLNLMSIIRRAPTVGQYRVGWQLPIAIDSYLVEDYRVADQIAVHELSLVAAQQSADQLGQRWAYGLLGEAYYHARRHEEAIECLQRGLEIAERIDDNFGRAANLGDLARSCIELERYREAADYSLEALRINRAIGNRRNEGIDLLHLGNALSYLGEHDEGLTHLTQGRAILRDIGASGSEAIALRLIARILYVRGQGDEAVRHLQAAAALYRVLNVDHWYGETLRECGEVFAGLGRLPEARIAWREAVDVLIDRDPQQASEIGRLLADLEDVDSTES